jgi:TatD DNase family protein
MNWIDTHTHIYLEEFDEDRSTVVQRAIDQGVNRLCLPNVDIQTIESLLALVDKYPEHCFPMMGLHPCSVKEDFEDQLSAIKKVLLNEKYRIIAVGEIGMDLYWDASTKGIQEEAFRRQISWALELNLPIVVHIRNAFDETFEIVKDYDDTGLKAVFHCFTGNAKQAEWLQSRGYYLGLGGVLTYKNAGLKEIVADFDRAKIVLETDAPYLSPVPFRGKRNEPAYIPHIAKVLAHAWNVSLEEVARISTRNAQTIFQYV